MTNSPALTLAICTYTEARFELLQEAIVSVLAQKDVDLHLLIVVDHNDGLASRLAQEFPGVQVVTNAFARGLSGAKNTAIEECTTPLLGFIDDDESLSACWARRLVDILDDPDVFAAGSAVHPRWETSRPVWLAPEFDWVIGCSYQGLPTEQANVRNLQGGACIIRLDAVRKVGGFRSDLGRIGTTPIGCEETELFLRLHELFPTGQAIFAPQVQVEHFVPITRCTWSYFVHRCFSEGVSKALVASLHSEKNALAAEHQHLMRTLPKAAIREVRSGNPLRVLAFFVGAGAAVVGYGGGCVQARRRGSAVVADRSTEIAA